MGIHTGRNAPIELDNGNSERKSPSSWGYGIDSHPIYRSLILWMIGNITDLDDSTICLDCLKAESVDGSGNPGPHVDHDILGEICLGKSSYLYLKVVPEELKEEAIDSLEN